MTRHSPPWLATLEAEPRSGRPRPSRVSFREQRDRKQSEFDQSGLPVGMSPTGDDD